MYNSLKKLVGIFGITVFLVESFSFAQDINDVKYVPPTTDEQLKTSEEKTTSVNNGMGGTSDCDATCQALRKSLTQGGDMCPDGQKEYTVDGKRQCCDGIFLNTNVPFIGQCISFGNGASTESQTTVNEQTAFPVLMGGLTKMLVTIILLISFIGILAGGVMIASSGGSDSGASNGKKLIGRVIVALAILGASGVILRLINPNFFG